VSNFHSEINILSELQLLDWLIFGMACGICILLVIYGYRTKNKILKNTAQSNSLLEYLLMGRQLTLPLFVTTLVATWYGNIFGVTQIAFEQGIYNLFTQGIFWYITYIIFALFIVKKIRQYNVITLPELVKKIYGPHSAYLAAILVFFKTLPIPYAISMGLLLQCFLPITLMQSTIIGVMLIAVYTISGGLRTIVYSDVALFIIMCLGVSCVLFFSIINFGGLAFLQAHLSPHYFKICGTHSLSSTLTWFFIACSTTFISPAFYQRCLAAMSDQVAIKGILISTVIWFLFDICTTFGAMYAKVLIPQADSLRAYIIYGIQLLPPGFKGLFLASIAASIIATLESFLFIASNILFYDLNIIKVKNLKIKHFTAIIISATLTIIISLFFEGKIENSWLTLKGYFSVCLLLPIILGYIYPQYATDSLFIYNCIISCSILTLWKYLFKHKYPSIEPLYIGYLTTCIVFMYHNIRSKSQQIIKD